MIDVRVSTTPEDDALSNEIYSTVWPAFAFTAEEAQAFKRAMPDADDYLARVDGIDAGSAFTSIRPERPRVAFALVTVLPEQRGRGVGGTLYDSVSRWASDRGLDSIESFVDEDDAESVAFAAKRGFDPVERFERLALDLASAPELDVAAPPGIEITLWRDADDVSRGIYSVALEAYRDEPWGEDGEVEPYEDWLEHEVRRLEGFGGATFVAHAGGEAVGFAQLSVTAARPGTASHAFTGVKRAWRGRGVAGALKRAQIEWARSHGFSRLVTQNEESNVPMLRLNDRLGYRVESSRLLVRGPLSGGA